MTIIGKCEECGTVTGYRVICFACRPNEIKRLEKEIADARAQNKRLIAQNYNLAKRLNDTITLFLISSTRL